MELITFLIIGELISLISIANWILGINKELKKLNNNLNTLINNDVKRTIRQDRE